ncbi:hypothetical protein B0H16DRAFT_1821010 [Mycena metata]|uniref:Uncharacterized protein n=1 Tax=Mycena metata TaxID=1033252 RepID=A0AAD7MC87_9AGAR|nr:hypothetical protein B0H16DRAFT_1821010 [Mycena metata]
MSPGLHDQPSSSALVLLGIFPILYRLYYFISICVGLSIHRGFALMWTVASKILLPQSHCRSYFYPFQIATNSASLWWLGSRFSPLAPLTIRIRGEICEWLGVAAVYSSSKPPTSQSNLLKFVFTISKLESTDLLTLVLLGETRGDATLQIHICIPAHLVTLGAWIDAAPTDNISGSVFANWVSLYAESLPPSGHFAPRNTAFQRNLRTSSTVPWGAICVPLSFWPIYLQFVPTPDDEMQGNGRRLRHQSQSNFQRGRRLVVDLCRLKRIPFIRLGWRRRDFYLSEPLANGSAPITTFRGRVGTVVLTYADSARCISTNINTSAQGGRGPRNEVDGILVPEVNCPLLPGVPAEVKVKVKFNFRLKNLQARFANLERCTVQNGEIQNCANLAVLAFTKLGISGSPASGPLP